MCGVCTCMHVDMYVGTRAWKCTGLILVSSSIATHLIEVGFLGEGGPYQLAYSS